MRSRRAFVLFATLLAVACGKSRVHEEPTRSWEEPSAENGFYDLDRACALACLVDADRAARPKRTSPRPRMVGSFDAAAGLVSAGSHCIAGAADGVSLDGAVVCTDPADAEGRTTYLTRVGMPSALAYTDRIWIADRDPNGLSHVFAGDELVASNETDVRTLVDHRGSVFWIDGNERIRSAAVTTTRVEVETKTRLPRVDARFLAVDDAAFYVVRGGSLIRLSRDGASPRTLAVVRTPIRDVVLAGEWLYWSELGDSRLQCNRDGSRPSCEGRGRPIIHPHGALRRVRVAPPFDTQTVASDLEDVDGVLVARSFAYVTTKHGVARIPIAVGAGASQTILSTDAPAFGRPALDTLSWTLFVVTRPERASRTAEIVALAP